VEKISPYDLEFPPTVNIGLLGVRAFLDGMLFALIQRPIPNGRVLTAI
jgi:hypothetical protein